MAGKIKPSERGSLWREQMASDNERRTNRKKPSAYESEHQRDAEINKKVLWHVCVSVKKCA